MAGPAVAVGAWRFAARHARPCARMSTSPSLDGALMQTDRRRDGRGTRGGDGRGGRGHALAGRHATGCLEGTTAAPRRVPRLPRGHARAVRTDDPAASRGSETGRRSLGRIVLHLGAALVAVGPDARGRSPVHEPGLVAARHQPDVDHDRTRAGGAAGSAHDLARARGDVQPRGAARAPPVRLDRLPALPARDRRLRALRRRGVHLRVLLLRDGAVRSGPHRPELGLPDPGLRVPGPPPIRRIPTAGPVRGADGHRRSASSSGSSRRSTPPPRCSGSSSERSRSQPCRSRTDTASSRPAGGARRPTGSRR